MNGTPSAETTGINSAHPEYGDNQIAAGPTPKPNHQQPNVGIVSSHASSVSNPVRPNLPFNGPFAGPAAPPNRI